MTAAHIAQGCILLALLIYAIDLGLAHFAEWRKRRDAHITAKRMRQWNVAAFRGARKFDDPRWPT